MERRAQWAQDYLHSGYHEHVSHRLQVLIPEELDLALAQAAARERISKGEFVRSAIEAALAQRVADEDPVATIAAINAPTADIEQLLAEIDTRYG